MKYWKCYKSDKRKHSGDMIEYFVIGKVYEEKEDGIICENGNVFYSGTEWLEDCGYYLKEAPKPFSIDDIKPCMLVKTRDGNIGIVSQANDKLTINYDGNNGCLELDNKNYNQELKDTECFEEYDIMEVYGFSSYYLNANKISTADRPLLWKREEKSEKELKIEELQQKLTELESEKEKLENE